MYIALGTTTIERTPVSNLKGIKKMIVAAMAVGAIVGLSACNGDTTSATSGNNNASNSSSIDVAKGGESQDKYLGPLMEEVFASKTVGDLQIAGEHLLCFAEKNKSWGIKTVPQAAEAYKKHHPDVDTTSYDIAVNATVSMTEEQWREYDAWTEEASKDAMSKGLDAVQEQGLMCMVWKYHTSHAPLGF